jgi:hypothetical protein
MLFFWLTLRQYINERRNIDIQPFDGKLLIENEKKEI